MDRKWLFLFKLMKNAVALILLIIYSFTSFGTTIHIHYCMNEYAGWSLSVDKESSSCAKCGMSEHDGKGCCSDQQTILKLTLDQNIHSGEIPSLDRQVCVLPQSFSPLTCFITEIAAVNYSYKSPPWQNHSRLHIFYCVFLI